MSMSRKAGVLCHISSLPGKYGIGSLGAEAYVFAKKLKKCGIKYWQVLPLQQTGFGNSPYQSVSCDSGNPYFIDLNALCKEGLLTKTELKDAEKTGPIDYVQLFNERFPLLRKAFSRFFFDAPAFREYVNGGESEDYALFMTAKTVYGGSFCDWDEKLKRRDADALEALRTDYHEEYLFWHFLQYQFKRQWRALKDYCNGLGIKIIGDIPLYVAYDSADVWAHGELFKLDKELKPAFVAGVPPDYFSETGQLWGNPVYDWKAHEKSGFAWWRARLQTALSTYDVVRIDHFRGISAYYEIEYGAKDARGGAWRKGPGEKLFEGLPRDGFIAEDLGTIDEGVRDLLLKTEFPGMKVLLFAFDGNPDNPFLLKNIPENSVCYTGTHDNDTVEGYVEQLSAEEYILFRSRLASELAQANIVMNLGKGQGSISEAFVRLALASKAKLAVVSLQDVLGLGNEARMNFPGTNEGNWEFRLTAQPAARSLSKLKKAVKKYGRK